MSERNTTAVLPPDLARDDEMNQSSDVLQAPATSPFTLTASGQGGNAKAAPERKRPGRLSEAKRFKIFSGLANKSLAEEVCKFVGVPLGETKMQRFSDGEIYFQLLENVRGADVFVIQPTCYPVA